MRILPTTGERVWRVTVFKGPDMKTLTIVLSIVGMTIACAPAGEESPAVEQQSAAAAEALESCEPTDDLSFLCGMAAPEDLVPVPNMRWLIASGMEVGSGLHAIDTATKTSQPLLTNGLDGRRADPVRFPGCPSPLDPSQAVLHGLSLRPVEEGVYTLYATNHGGRESVEVFELKMQGGEPSVAWVGCVPMVDDLAANSVAVFGDGTVLTTVVILPGFAFEDMFAGVSTGAVFQWTPGAETFEMLQGTGLAGNNGIETAPDDSTFYVAAVGGREVVAFSREDPSTPLWRAPLDGFAPDNVRLVDGQLITAGMIDDEPACGGPPTSPEGIQCPRGYIAAAIDPDTGAVTELARGPAAPPYTGTATAIPMDDELWLSSFNSDRVAWRPMER